MIDRYLASLTLALSFCHTALADERVAIVGTWQIKSFSIQSLETKETTRPFGESPIGYIQYSPGGYMIVFLQSGDPKRPTHNPFTDAERAEAHRTIFGAYAGKYTVEGNKVVHHIEASWRPEWIGTQQTRFFEMDGKKLTLKTAPQTSTVLSGQTVATLGFEKVE
jgi:hypothetical protein